MTENSQDKVRATLVRALREVERLRLKVAALEGAASEPIAIVGIGLRLPGGVVDLGSLWCLLERELDTVRSIPSSRWDADAVYSAERRADKTYTREAALLDQVDAFDPGFFNITPREARHIDPQHRLLLEASWEALEHADIIPATLAESQTGVFVGIGPSDYQQLLRGPQRDPYTTTGTHMSFAAGRVAFTLGLQGPAVSIDTACSSSLVALHLACQSLRAGECSLALAAGVQVLASPEAFIHLAQTQALAPDGRCKTFSANADGYGRGEGVVVLALQRLTDAKTQARPVLAVVRGSAVTHDGRSSGITAPNGSSQQKVLRAALAAAHVAATDVDVIECHGTGTSLGDPIEVRALATVYGVNREPDRPLLLGTIKTNIGHLESAAGLAGVAKVIASMRAEQLPASLHSQPRNPHIDWDKLPVAVVDARRAWSRNPQRPRLAGVSGFGLSGTNCHVILEEPELPTKLETDRSEPPPLLPFVLSARSEPALRAQAERLLTTLDQHASTVDLAFSLAAHRTHFDRRVALVPTPERSLAAVLRSFINEPASVGVAPAQSTLAVLFTGQGAQYLGMGSTLERCEPNYRDAFAQVCEQLDRHLEIPLREVMYAAADAPQHGLLDQTQYTQAALFALEVALYRLYESWGVRPTLLLGHSIGELTAAHVSGVLSLEDACRLVAARGRLMQALPPGGAMLSLQASEREVNAAIAEVVAVEIAGLNGPMSTVVSGPTQAIDAIATHFTRLGRKARRLSVSHAFHSSLMQPMLDEFRAVASSLQFRPAQIPIVSNVSGNIASAAELSSPDYWARHVRQAVRFLDGVRTLEAKGATVMLEIGPHGVLSSMAAGCLSELGQQRVTIVPSLRRDRGDDLAIAQALALLHCSGVAIDWNAYFARHSPTRVDLPFYPFQRERHWVEQRPAAVETAAIGRYALSGQRIELPTGVIHRIAVGPRLQSYLGDHRVYGVLVVPGAFHVAVALAIGESHWPDRAIELRNVEFVRALTFESDDVVLDLHVELTPDADGWDVKLMTRQGEQWVTHANMSMRPIDAPAIGPQLNVAELALEDRTPEHRQGLEEREIVWGPKWWWLDGVEQRASDRAIGRLTAKDGTPDDDAPIPGGYLDNSFSLLSFAFHETDPSDRTPRLPFSLERLVWFGQRTAPRFSSVLADRERSTADTVVADISIYDPSGQPLAELERFVVRRAPADRFLPSSSTQHVWRIEWVAADAAAQPLTSWRGLGTNTLELASWDAVPELEHLVELATQPQTSIRTVVAGLVFPEADAQEYATRALHLLQTWLAEPRLAELELVIATRRALGCAPNERCDVAASVVWGLTRSARAEAPSQRIRLIDIDDTPDSRAQWERALAIDSSELAIRSGQILAPRLAAAPAPASAGFDATGTCLITGATGSLGRLLTLHLVRQHGVKHLLLLSRAGSSAASASALAAECTQAGAKVILQTCDVAERASLQAALASIPSSAPLTAVFHLAGVVDDAVLSKLDEAAIARVFRPKLIGALNLHELAPSSVQTFVLFSSLSGTLGSAGQANYAAANAALDALAHDRRAQGLPAVSLAWGPWGQVGMAASLSEGDRARLERQGVNLFDNDQALAAFDLALRQPDPVLVPVSLDRQKLAERSGPLSPMLAHLITGRRRPANEPGNALLEQLKSSSISERSTILRELVRTETAAILGLGDAHAVDPDRLLQELGLDSLVAVELRNQLQRKTGVRLSATLTFDYPTVNAIAGFLDGQLTPKVAGERRPAPAPTRASVTTTGREVAIVGMACRLPGGISSPEDLWQLLADGRDAIGEFPTDRGWPRDLYNPDPDARGKSAASGGGFLYDAAEFDHTFFGIGTQEAVHIDPQHRLLLETSWEAFERAGIRPHSLRESLTGVYLGIMYNEYGTLAGSLDNYNGQVATGSASSVASGRIAYTLGLQGPAVTVDTACSSSLVALHMACQALREHECDLAIAGGASVMSTPMTFVEFSRLLGMAPDGRCKPFSDSADGVGWGEGVGLLVLERLADAQKHNRNILAVIKGSALNHDGRSQGLTAPNGPAQQRVIQAALTAAKLEFDDIDAIEAHGTGTTLGDPIEAEAIANTYGRARRPDRPLWIGSIKSNLGHTQASAGVASIIKIVLAMRHQQLPRTLHAEVLSRHIDWNETPVRLLDAPVEWSTSDRPRRAAVSSFGISGTNAHVILEEHATAAAKSHELDARTLPVPLLLSGKSPAAVQAQARKLRAALNGRTDLRLVDVGHTLANHRTHFEFRAAVVSHDLETAQKSLDALAEGRPSPHAVPIARATHGHLTYLFTGQGSQLPGMGRELADSYPEFADALRETFAFINPLLGCPLDAIVFAESSEASARIHETGFAQPALFALEVALFRLLHRWGLRPHHLLGHSIGEIAAAHVAGVFSLEDACKLVVGRGRLMQALPTGGAMYSLQANEHEVASALRRFGDAKLGIAGLNGPNSTVISGEASAAGELASHFQQLGRKTHRLSVSHAFHSPLMDPMLDEFAALVGSLQLSPPTIPIISNLTGRVAGPELCQPDYWVRHVREPVRFVQGIQTLEALGATHFLELGPHGVLVAMASDCLSQDSLHTRVLVPCLRRDQSETQCMATALATLHTRNADVDIAWTDYFAHQDALQVELPTYAFQRQRFWLSDGRGWAERVSDEAPRSAVDAERFLALPSRAEQRALLATVVEQETSAALTLTEALDFDRGFSDLGIDSLTAVQLRNALQDRLGLKVPINAFFEHLTVDAFVDATLAAAPAPQPRPESTDRSDAQDPAGGSMAQFIHMARSHADAQRARTQSSPGVLVPMLARLLDAQDLDAAFGLIESLAAARKPQHGEERLARPAPLPLAKRASNTRCPALYCVPSLAAPSSPMQFARLAKHIGDGAFSMWGGFNLGYAPDDALPENMGPTLEHHVAAAASCADGQPYALLGYSAGSWVAMDVAARALQSSTPPTALILLDPVYPGAMGREGSRKSQAAFIRQTLDFQRRYRSDESEGSIVSEITAMRHYFEQYETRWTPPRLRIPTLYVHATRGSVDEHGQPVLSTDPKQHWAELFEHFTVHDLECDHFDLVNSEQHTRHVVEAICEWWPSAVDLND